MSRQVVQKLKKLDEFRSGSVRDFTDHLASALGWGEDEYTPIQARRDLSRPEFEVSVASVGDRPAILFVSSTHELEDITGDISCLGYNLASDWSVASNGRETTLLHSRWLTADDEWYRLPSVKAEELSEHTPLFSQLTPSSMLKGGPENYCRRRLGPSTVLLPVDDSLVDRLDAWRDEALRHASDIRNLDERLQQLFAQFFVLRAVEDRALSAEQPVLSSVLRGDGTANKAALRRLFAHAREEIESSLFSERSFADVPSNIIGGIIDDLYRPRNVPQRLVLYDFSLISAQVLGRAYEKYLSTIVMPSRILDPQLRIWDQPLRDARRVTVRRSRGIYYTPPALVSYTTEAALDEYYSPPSQKTAASPPLVADPACGSGSFLLAALESISARQREAGRNPYRLRDLVDRGVVFGVDIDPRAVTLARLSLWLRLAEEDDPLPLPSLHKYIYQGDALYDLEEWYGSFDIVLGNPPFASVSAIRHRKDLEDRFKVARGRFDYSYLFVELATYLLRPGGCLGLIAPNRLLTSRDANEVRNLLASECHVSAIVDFGSLKPFEGIDAYIAVVIATKRDEDADEDNRWLRAIKMKDIDAPFLSHQLRLATRAEAASETTVLDAFDRPAFDRGEVWKLLDVEALDFVINVKEQSRMLEDIADTFQGIKTGSNPVFILDLLSAKGSNILVRDGFGAEFEIERAIVRPVVFGGDIQRYGLLQPSKAVVYPYEDDYVIGGDRLRDEFPLAYSHLRKHRHILERRKSLERTGGDWYELLWRRSSGWLDMPKIVMKELAQVSSGALDIDGEVYLIGGVAIAPFDAEHLLPLFAFLNSRVADWLLRSSSPTFQGQYAKFEAQAIRRLPVPESILTPESVEVLTNLAQRAMVTESEPTSENRLAQKEIDHTVLEALGIDEGTLA